MRVASSAAWDLDWTRAAAAYEKALTEQEDDAQALTGLALAMMETGREDEALSIYQRITQIVPNDPLPYEKIADIYLVRGNKRDAANAYLDVAELYHNRDDSEQAVEYWQKAIALNPDLPKAHMRLASVFSQRKDINQAVVHFVEVARLLQKFEQKKKAEDALQRALSLDPTSQLARNAVDDLRRERPIGRTPGFEEVETVEPATSMKRITDDDADVDVFDDEEKYRTPIDEAAWKAMGTLAEMVFSGEVPSKAQEPLLQAMDLHQVGDADGAIERYTRAHQVGLGHPALRLNMGILNHYVGNHRDSVGVLQELIEIPDYTLAGRIVMGMAYDALGDSAQASEQLLHALYLADRTVNSQVDEAGYQRLLASLSERQPDQLEDISQGLIVFLNDSLWRKKLEDALGGYAAQGKSSYVTNLIELIVEGGRPVLAEIMQRVDHYVENDMIEMASQEAHYAIEKSPDYLPAHKRIADILVTMGHTQEAAEKVNYVAETYMLRGNDEKAADLFAEVLEIWPADMDARRRVIDMLKTQKRSSETLRHYLELADLYRRMADTTSAQSIYEEALEYTRKNSRDSPKVVAILKALADIEVQRFNWRKALEYYEEIIKQAPDDEDATLSVVDLYFQQGSAAQAVASLDDYMRQCITRGQPQRILPILEEQVRKHSGQIQLRLRLAQVYIRQNRTSDAIVQLNEIGDMQIEAGQYEAATQTIKRIISLNPPDTEQYRQLLSQLESNSL
ncbi:MAG: tetratricopeptide repeat protein [Chloroflexi bacterium]|nr:tetratricopeptide repeat protein [Chloroflexota bacterium]